MWSELKGESCAHYLEAADSYGKLMKIMNFFFYNAPLDNNLWILICYK